MLDVGGVETLSGVIVSLGTFAKEEGTEEEEED